MCKVAYSAFEEYIGEPELGTALNFYSENSMFASFVAPAFNAFLKKNSATFNYNILYSKLETSSIKLLSGGISVKNFEDRFSAFSIGFSRFSVTGGGDDIYPAFGYYESVYLLSMGKKISDNFSVGIAGKLFSIQVDENDYTKIQSFFSSYGYKKSCLSLAASFAFIVKKTTLFLSMDNINQPDISFADKGVNMKRIYYSGMEYKSFSYMWFSVLFKYQNDYMLNFSLFFKPFKNDVFLVIISSTPYPVPAGSISASLLLRGFKIKYNFSIPFSVFGKNGGIHRMGVDYYF